LRVGRIDTQGLIQIGDCTLVLPKKEQGIASIDVVERHRPRFQAQIFAEVLEREPCKSLNFAVAVLRRLDFIGIGASIECVSILGSRRIAWLKSRMAASG